MNESDPEPMIATKKTHMINATHVVPHIGEQASEPALVLVGNDRSGGVYERLAQSLAIQDRVRNAICLCFTSIPLFRRSILLLKIANNWKNNTWNRNRDSEMHLKKYKKYFPLRITSTKLCTLKCMPFHMNSEST